ncbi:uncharacterized protein [Eurosta solidaginis]|uniref:uncharacterized protein n=1 Tax=Eurosta solidaginis TaxID=178769 RepID=UPI0035313057
MDFTAGDRDSIACDDITSQMTIPMAETIKTNDYMVGNRKSQNDANSSSEVLYKKLESTQVKQRARIAEGLRRQQTIYPHGLNINIETGSNENQTNSNSNSNSDMNSSCDYSRASTLRSSWDGKYLIKHSKTTSSKCNEYVNHTSNDRNSAPDACHRKYRISMISSPENLAKLQMRRYKYPLTGNYYLDTQDVASSKHPPPLPVLRTYLQRFGRWKYLRWPIIFLACTLLFFGIITYCIWLHDVSVARERYHQRRQELGKQEEISGNEAQVISFVANSVDAKKSNETHETTTVHITTDTFVDVVTEYNQPLLHQSTVLRAITTHINQSPKEQKLATFEYAKPSKGAITTDKELIKDRDRGTGETTSESTIYAGAEAAHILHYGGFNEHQNSFGVPIEDAHHLLRLFNNIFSSDQPVSTTKSLTKVSPTIPPVTQFKPTHAMSSGFRSTVQDNGCYSTSLSMCQGVLDYDLTYNSTTKLQLNDETAFRKLIESNCSARALEFICVTLEPECRPSHIGILPPCRRICKAVVEACSIVIANWDVLNELFDCGVYPDSSDPHKCEDPTRRHDQCFDHEFSCYDRSCIPQQWQCDNIKDCAAGEDEESCLICDHQDEFRCRSNEKCVPGSVRCDLKYDCFDGSDEEECDEYGSGEEAASAFDEAALNSFPRVFSYTSFLSPNQSNEGLYTYITAATNDENGTKFQVHEITNRTRGISTEEVTNSVPDEGPKGFVNFRDSKEIMLTSDTENNFKYSSAATTSRHLLRNRNTSVNQNKLSFGVTPPLKPEASMRISVTNEPPTPPKNDTANNKHPLSPTCAPHQLRCVSGECITVNQLCDKIMDCPDGADELMCIYKEQRSSTSTTLRSSTDSALRSRRVRTQPTIISTTIRYERRSSARNTIKRKVNP